ncbi:histone H4 transcription factor [Ixodes scapularis]|uniref:histone H4 transcription factor n=1 Tax=Ixodes scapularis TaxID=6945 RepID=UPI001A9CC028|nr:histone H4 transcription factor [Ixodes scapularis]
MIRAEVAQNLQFKGENVVLRCEWLECDFVSGISPEFYTHVNKHLKEDATLLDTSECPWRDCSTVPKSRGELRTHVLFHAFHTKIKCYGQNLVERQKTPQRCQLDKQTRNLIPDTPEQFECQWEGCDDADFENPEAFYEHVSNHAEDEAGPRSDSARCRWFSCDAESTTVYKLKDHLRTHTQEKKLACPDCGGMFASRTKLVDHLARQVERPELSCSYCNRGFSSERLLRDHIRHHVNQYKCAACDMTCPTPSALKYHMQWRHSTARPYECDHCDFSAKTPGDLRKHLEAHGGESKPCPLPGCEFVARSSYLLRKHVRTNHLCYPKNVYMCHLCQKQYASGNSLSRHLVSQHRFKWPSGHTRFSYTRNKDNVFTLQTVRYESIELTEAEPAASEPADQAAGLPRLAEDLAVSSPVAAAALPATDVSLSAAAVALPEAAAASPVAAVVLPATDAGIQIGLVAVADQGGALAAMPVAQVLAHLPPSSAVGISSVTKDAS